jgi:glycyl-tRNA synthetase beta chain
MDSRLRGNDEDISVRALADQAERAARLCKADLVTGMVGEFPELQGIMGGYYARAQGESDAVADAVRDHYKPVGQGDDVPTAPLTVAVSLADKLDTLVGFFSEGMLPTGSKDPFALRRAAIGNLDVVQQTAMRLPVIATVGEAIRIRARQLVEKSQTIDPGVTKLIQEFPLEGSATPIVFEKLNQMKEASSEIGLALKPNYDPRAMQLCVDALRLLADRESIEVQLLDFLADRLKVQQREAGVRHDLIDAVFSLGGEDDLVRLLARVKALQAYITTAEGANLLAAYKRAANILKQADGAEKTSVAPAQAGAHHVSQSGTTDETGSSLRWSDADLGIEELALRTALDAGEPKAAAALSVEDFEGAMAALATLRAPIDAFFEAVMVNDPDQDKRAFRLGLLARFRDAVHQVADFSKIEG